MRRRVILFQWTAVSFRLITTLLAPAFCRFLQWHNQPFPAMLSLFSSSTLIRTLPFWIHTPFFILVLPYFVSYTLSAYPDRVYKYYRSFSDLTERFPTNRKGAGENSKEFLFSPYRFSFLLWNYKGFQLNKYKLINVHFSSYRGENGLPHLICELFHFRQWRKKLCSWRENPMKWFACMIKHRKIVKNAPLTL